MEPEKLVGKFEGCVVFLGGVDTQDLLLNGSPAKVEKEVERLLKAFGNSFILGPSHEALLPNVSAENVLQMARQQRFLNESISK